MNEEKIRIKKQMIKSADHKRQHLWFQNKQPQIVISNGKEKQRQSQDRLKNRRQKSQQNTMETQRKLNTFGGRKNEFLRL